MATDMLSKASVWVESILLCSTLTYTKTSAKNGQHNNRVSQDHQVSLHLSIPFAFVVLWRILPGSWKPDINLQLYYIKSLSFVQ